MFLTDLIKPQIAFGSGGGGSGGGGSSSSKSKSSSSKSKSKSSGGGKGSSSKSTSSGGRNLDADMKAGSNYAPTKNAGTSKAKQTTPKATTSSPKSSGGGKGSKPKSTSTGRNLDADMFAGSGYAPTKNAGTKDAYQVTYTNDTYGPDRKEVKVTGKTTDFNSKTSVTAKDLADGNVSTYKAKNGVGSVTVAQGTKFDDVPEVDVGGKKNSDAYDNKDVATPTKTPPVVTTNNGGGSTAPVTAPEKIDPRDGVGGGRDGGKARKSTASKTDEDKVAIARKAQGVNRYKIRGGRSVAAATRGRRTNSLSIRQNRSS